MCNCINNEETKTLLRALTVVIGKIKESTNCSQHDLKKVNALVQQAEKLLQTEFEYTESIIETPQNTFLDVTLKTVGKKAKELHSIAISL